MQTQELILNIINRIPIASGPWDDVLRKLFTFPENLRYVLLSFCNRVWTAKTSIILCCVPQCACTAAAVLTPP